MKLSFDALKLRAEVIASNALLATISGGNNNDCHDTPATTAPAETPKPTFEVGPSPNTPVIYMPSPRITITF